MPTLNKTRGLNTVDMSTRTIGVVNLTIHEPLVESGLAEVHLYVNGRKISSMHPHRARQLGLLEDSSPTSAVSEW